MQIIPPGFPEAPADGQEYVRKNRAWAVATGGGGGGSTYPEVASWADLPVTIGTPVVGALYYVQTSTADYWLFNKKPSGLWRRIADTGVLAADWDEAGDLADILPPQVSQAEAEAGTGTGIKSWTPERVKQAILAFLTWSNITGKPSTFAPIIGSGPGDAVAGNDSRLTNARTPTAHAASHQHSGGDEIATATPAANAIPKANASGKLDAWISAATGAIAGLLAAADKAKLDTLNGAEATVASATTTDLGALASEHVSITGNTTITGFGTVAAGTRRSGRFTGALLLTHNATSLILPGAANITTAAGDRFTAVSLGSGNWVVYHYTKADGTAVVGGGGGGSVSDSAFSSSWNADTTNAPSKNALWDHLSEPSPVCFSGAILQHANMAAAADFLTGGAGGQRYIQKLDLTGKTQVRFLVNKYTIAAASGAKLALRYNATFSSTPGDYSDIGTSAVEVAIDTSTAQVLDTGWIDLATGAKAHIFAALISYGSDGVADPTFGNIQAQFR